MNADDIPFRLCRGPINVCTEAEFGKKLGAAVSEKVCTLATVSPTGHPECAVVGFAILPEGKIVIHTHKFSRKWANLACNPRVAFAISAGVYAPYFQIEGVAQLFDFGSRHELMESIYIKEHPKALALANDFTTGTVEISSMWVRYFKWPRESGHCVEWLVGRQSHSLGGLVLRNSYDSEAEKVCDFVREIGGSDPLPNDWTIIAEDDGIIVASMSLHKTRSGEVVICGLHTDRRVLREHIGKAMLAIVKTVVNPFRCFGKVSASDLPLFLSSGFRPAPTESISANLDRLLASVTSESESVAIRLN